MGSDSTWVTCKHVMNGSATHIKMRPEKICLCSACVDSINLIKTKEICIIDQRRLEDIIEDIEQIDGLWHLGKYRDLHGKFASDRRMYSERRSNVDRRLGGAFLNTGSDRRIVKRDRRMIERRAEITNA